LVAADAQYVYGIRYANGGTFGEGAIIRWPIAGGPVQVMVQGKTFWFGNPQDFETSYPGVVPLVVDQDHIYFSAAPSAMDLSASLFSMPVDDSALPTMHGTAGLLLAQDQDLLYFSNDGDSRVLRVQKNALDGTREEIFRSSTDAPGSITRLSVNSTTVFVAEVPAHAIRPFAQFSIWRVDKATRSATKLATSDALTVTPNQVLADDVYVVVVGAAIGNVAATGANRVDLSTLEIKDLPYGGMAAVAGGDLFTISPGNATDVTVVHLSTAMYSHLLGGYPLVPLWLIARPGILYVTVGRNPSITGNYNAVSLVSISLTP
jgi:hypothetical protein